jgi:hypothetical protein
VSDDAKTFTGWKLDVLKGIAADRRIKPMEFEWAFCVMQHANQKTRSAFVGDEAIRDKTGICERESYRARRRLKETGWLDWTRTRSANVYTFRDENLNAILDILEACKEHRLESRRKKQRTHVRTQESEHNGIDRTQESKHVRTRESDIHLRATPSEIQQSKKES